MSTRCQIGFYGTPEQALSEPDALVYKHSDGYPDTDCGILAKLKPFCQDFAKRRGLDDTEYAAAWCLYAFMDESDARRARWANHSALAVCRKLAEGLASNEVKALIKEAQEAIKDPGLDFSSMAYCGYGICGDRKLHGDIAYYYRVDPSGITVYTVHYNPKSTETGWLDLEKVKHLKLASKPRRNAIAASGIRPDVTFSA